MDNLEYYPLTFAQRGIWHIEKTYPHTGVANIAGDVRLKGNVDFNLLEKAVNSAIEKNDSMQLRIAERAGEPCQYFSEYQYNKLDFFNFSNEDELYEFGSRLTAEPFRLMDSQLYYFALVRINEDDGGFYVKTHHLISDAWTMTLLVNQIVDGYTSLKNGAIPADGKRPSYREYILSEMDYMRSEKYIRNKEYWEDRFSTTPELTALKPGIPPYGSIRAARRTFYISRALTSKIQDYCRETGVSPFTLFLSVLYIYLRIITSKKDIVVGTPILNRTNAREKEITGMFISLVPFRASCNGGETFDSFVRTVAQEFRQVMKNQKYPFELTLQSYREKHKLAGGLYDAVVSYQNARFIKDEQEYITRWHFNGYDTDAVTLHIDDREGEGYFILNYDYRLEAFTPEEIDRMHANMTVLLQDALNSPQKAVSQLEILDADEKRRLLHDFNNTAADYPEDKTIHGLFKEQAGKTPRNAAVIYEGGSLTYEELNEKADRLAVTLREKGVRPGDMVGITAQRSLEMIAGLLGILKAGGAYLPIDPGYPAERISYILKDSRAGMLLTDHSAGATARFDGIVVDLKDSVSYAPPGPAPENVSKATDPAYAIYTSGSSGKPKGVLIEHRSILNTLCWRKKYYGLNEKDAVLQIPSFSFDSSVEDIFTALLSGAVLVLIDDGQRLNMDYLKRVMGKNRVTHFIMVPGLYKSFLSSIGKGSSPLRAVTVAGEQTPGSLVAEHFKKLGGVRLINEYGPTENSVCTTAYEFVSSGRNILIGKPINNTRIYIVNTDMRLLPRGIAGELCISGAGLARGYLGRPELTAERFVPNPFAPGERMYRTGDLARWLPDGNIEFLGRIDDQVKIRGFRIETGEIENALLGHEVVREAAAAAKEAGDGSKYLCAYYVSDMEIAPSQLKAFLSKTLPVYMVPACYKRLDRLPLTPNGKLDRKALPRPDEIRAADGYTAPRDEIEARLVDIWARALDARAETIGIDGNFFELGGDSLDIIRVLGYAASAGIELGAQELYLHQTVRQLAAFLREGKPSARECPDISGVVAGSFPESAAGTDIPEEKTDPSGIFLTGATGYLGIHLLDQLLSSTSARIYCLARGAGAETAKARLYGLMKFYFPEKYAGFPEERVSVLNGDVSQDRFGLCDPEYGRAAEETDMVVHAAALVKHYGKYEDFEKANVQGTKRAVDFACDFGKTLCHISTMSVSSGYPAGRPGKAAVFTERDFYIGQDCRSNVYVRSKFEAEKLVSEAVKSGLSAVIFRVGNLTGRYSDGHFQVNINENAFYNRLKAIIALGAIPENIAGQDIELTPVDMCSRAIVELALHKPSACNVFHVYNHEYIKLNYVVDIFNKLGCPIKVLDKKEFRDLADGFLKDGSRFEAVMGLVQDLGVKRELDYSASIVPDSKATQRHLARVGFRWPAPGEEYIKKIVDYMRSVGFL